MCFGNIGNPMLHAWNVDSATEHLYDFTWPMAPWNQYLGIVFDLAWTKEYCAMPHGIFHSENWSRNRDPIREYLASQSQANTDTPRD